MYLVLILYVFMSSFTYKQSMSIMNQKVLMLNFGAYEIFLFVMIRDRDQIYSICFTHLR